MLTTDIAQMKAECDALPYGNIVKQKTQIAHNHGIGYSQLCREIAKVYGSQKTVKREKKIDDSLIHEVAKMKEMGKKTGKKERELATDLCIQNLVDRNYAGADLLTPATVNRRLREKGYREVPAYVRVEASYANQQHQFDFSRSEYFQVQKFDGIDYILVITHNTTAYKENQFKLRTWIAGITDTFSRLSVAKAYAASGESVSLGIDFLNFAYNREPDNNPLRYLPERMKLDNGSFGKSKDVKEFFDKLNIKYEFATPNEKRGNQKRESAWKLMWRRFELNLVVKLGGNGKTISLTDYNLLLQDFLIQTMEHKHPIKNQTRGHVYLTSVAMREQRLMSEDLKKYIFRVMSRIVAGDKTISLEKLKYQVPDNIMVGEQIRVYKNLQNEVIGELINNPKGQKPFILSPTDGYKLLDDFSHRPHNTYQQDVVTEIKQEEKARKIAYMPIREKKVKPKSVFTEVEKKDETFASVYDAKVYIGNQLNQVGTNYAAYSGFFDPILANGLNKSGIDLVLQEIKRKSMVG